MSIVSLIAIYFIVWWVVLFAVLPFGVRTQEEDGEIVTGTTHSAPVRPMLVRKAIATTIVSAIIVGGLYVLMAVYGIDVEALSYIFGPQPR